MIRKFLGHILNSECPTLAAYRLLLLRAKTGQTLTVRYLSNTLLGVYQYGGDSL